LEAESSNESSINNLQIINESKITDHKSKIDKLQHFAPELRARLGVNRADG